MAGLALGAAASRFAASRLGFVLAGATVGLAYGAVGYCAFAGPTQAETIAASHKYADYLESKLRQA